MISNTKFFIIKNLKLIIFLFFYSTILIGFYLGENSTVGPKIDFLYHLETLKAFDADINFALLNYHKIDYPTRISPIFLLYLHYLNNIFLDIDLMRFVSLNIYLISPFLLYNCLKIKFNLINKNYLFIFSSLLYLSPAFRSNTIWPESSILGLLFFLFSIYFFLRFEKNKKLSFAILNVFFLSIAAYIRPSYCLFSIFFFIIFFKEFFFGYKIFIIFLLNILLSLPAFYYVFFLKVYFIHGHTLSFNLSDKVLIISTIIFFYFIPFLTTIYKSNKIQLLSKKSIYFFSLSIIAYFCLIPYFSYNINKSGGGIFLHLSHFLFNSNNLFLLISLISILVICYVLLIDVKKNYLLFLIFFLLAPQAHIFHKYFDPIILICIVLLFKMSISMIFEKKNLLFLYFYFLSFYIINLTNSLFIKF